MQRLIPISVLLITLLVPSITGCASKAELDDVLDQNSQLTSQVSDLEQQLSYKDQELDDANAEIDMLRDKVDDLASEVDDLHDDLSSNSGGPVQWIGPSPSRLPTFAPPPFPNN